METEEKPKLLSYEKIKEILKEKYLDGIVKESRGMLKGNDGSFIVTVTNNPVLNKWISNLVSDLVETKVELTLHTKFGEQNEGKKQINPQSDAKT